VPTSLIVDAHLHLYRTAEEGKRAKAGYEIWEYGPWDGARFSAHSGDPSSAIAAMNAAGASLAIVTNLLDVVRPGLAPGEDLLAFNQWLCDLAERDPRFVPFLAVDPSFLSVGDLVEHLRSMAEGRGARGIKLHPVLQRLDFAARDLSPIFALCQDLDLAVVSHSGPSRDGQPFGEPQAYRPLLANFPRLRVSIAHMGGAAWRQLPAIARDFPQAYFDCSEIIEWLGAPNAPSRDEFVALVREVGVGRVMMGSDFPWYDMDHTVELVGGLPGLSRAEQAAILGENAIRFFQLHW
jgi:predicted TIM-barrel fold metal-dependent hydrolase